MLPVEILTRVWAHSTPGVPSSSDVVHATSLAGPYRGGKSGAVHSLAVHDLLWRDEPSASTPRGIRFHETRLQLLRRRGDVRVILTAPGLFHRLVAEGFAPERLHEVRLGVDDDNVEPESEVNVHSRLAAARRQGTLHFVRRYEGTEKEPRTSRRSARPGASRDTKILVPWYWLVPRDGGAWRVRTRLCLER